MKRVIAAFVLLALAVAFAAWSGYTFDAKMDFFEKELNGLITVAESASENELHEETEKIVFQWEKSSGMLRSIVLHEGVDELERKIIALPQIAEHSGREEMKICCIEAINLIKNLKACEKISLENVL